ncbi:MAG TPA: hypothetical protein VGC79_21810, partial [Polyangiaceae bacterium]
KALPPRITIWRTYSASSETAGLWATQAQRLEWRHVVEITHGNNPLVVAPAGCADQLFPEFHGTDNWWTSIVTIPLMPTTERERIRHRVDAASTVVVAMVSREIVETPQFRDSFARLTRVWHGDVFDVYRR